MRKAHRKTDSDSTVCFIFAFELSLVVLNDLKLVEHPVNFFSRVVGAKLFQNMGLANRCGLISFEGVYPEAIVGYSVVRVEGKPVWF